MLVRHFGRIDDHGMIHLRSVAAWRASLARLKGKDVFLCVGRVAHSATTDQHRYYRGVVLPLLCEEWGWEDREELHFRLKEKHVPRELWIERKLGRAVLWFPPSSANLTVEQFSAFLSAVITHAAHEGVAIPEARQVEP